MKINTDTKTDEALAGCGYAILLLLIAPISSIWKGYVFSILWRWFIVTSFNAPPLGIAGSIGLMYVSFMLTYHFRPSRKDDRPASEKFAEIVSACFVGPTLALAFAAIVHLWM